MTMVRWGLNGKVNVRVRVSVQTWLVGPQSSIEDSFLVNAKSAIVDTLHHVTNLHVQSVH